MMNWMRRRGTAGRSAVFAVVAFMVAQLLAVPVHALPSGAETVYGEATISVSDRALTVSQASDRLIVNWEAFGIGAGEQVVFDQPGAAAIALNRVIGDDPSAIYGQLTANGRVFLLNPHGVLFGASAQVDVGGLVASTIELHDDDFLAGTYRFTDFNSHAQGHIVNEGQLSSEEGGFIALLGTRVDNRGEIQTPQGSAVLAAGGHLTLSVDSDGLLSVVVDEAALGAQVANGGLIVADGGRVLLTAQAKDALFETVLSHTGNIRAQSMVEQSGEIVLLGGMDGGTVVVDGTLDASAPGGGDGGFVETSGAHVRVEYGARVMTTAADGSAGVWLIDPTDYVIADADPADGSSYMSADTLATNLATTHVTIETLDAGEDAGDIFVNGAVSWNSEHSLTLKAHRNVEINANVTNDGEGHVIVRADKGGSGTGTVLFGGGEINTDGDVVIFYNPTNYATPTDFTDYATAGGKLTAYMLVNKVTDLQNINTNLAGDYALGRDIDASATRQWNEGAGFNPLGTLSDPFNGSFDGQGHVIDGLFINRTEEIGLFGRINSGRVVRDVGLTNVDVQGSGDRVGGLAGRNHGTVIESYVTGTVSGSSYVGGLVGSNNGTVSRSYSTATVNGSSSIGGLVGMNAGSVGRSYATGTVIGNDAVGGLVGLHSKGMVSESYATGAVTGVSTVGGLVGYSHSANSVQTSYWDIATTGKTEGCQGNGCPNAVGIGGETGADPFSQATYDGWDFDDTWYMIDGRTRPFLRMEHSTEIRNAHQLQLMRMDLGADYTLMTDIDLGTALMTSGGMWSENGFVPIGTSSHPFKGSFNGQGHVIDGLFINGTEEIGLFGRINTGRAVRDVGLTNVDVRGSGDSVGGLVGRNERGTISGSYVTGEVSGNWYVGGLVGWNHNGAVRDSFAAVLVNGNGPVGGLVGYNTGTLSRSYATGGVNGESYVGGLVGRHERGTISESYATGAVSGESDVGGLVGFHGNGLGLSDGTIANSYATGAVSGDNTVGGLVGFGDSRMTILNSYATGAVSGTDWVGGLVGWNLSNISSSYWDMETTGVATGCNVGKCPGIGGEDGPDPFTQATYKGWDFDNTWYMIDGETRPFLRMEHSTEIRNAHQLQLMRMDLGAEYTLMTDINLGAALAQNGGMWGEAGFVPIGSTSNPFTGSFDGQGHVIDGLTINRPETDRVGLFGSGVGVTISNLGLTHVDITGKDSVGSLIGYAGGAGIERSYATGVVTGIGDLGAGGLLGVGELLVEISDAYADVQVTGKEKVGGLVGFAMDNANITSSFAMGAVSGAGDVGGLVGYLDDVSNISNSYWDVEKTGVGAASGGGNGTVEATGVGGDGRPDPLSQATYAGLDFSNHFGMIDGISYPYLRWRFPDGPSVVSGTVSGVEGGNDRLGVDLAVEGEWVGTTTTGADGSYYMAVDPLNAGDAAVVWLDDANVYGNTFSVIDYQGHGTNFHIDSDVVHVTTNVKSMSETRASLMDAARGGLANESGRFLYSVSGGELELAAGISLNVMAPVGEFDIDQAIRTSESGSIAVEGESGNLTVTQNVNSDGTVTLMAHSNLTIAKGVTVTSAADGNAIVLSAGNSFHNNSGSNALVLTGDGRWLVYSGNVSQNTYGDLDSGNTAMWNASYTTRPPSTVNLPGNRYLFKEIASLYFYLPTDLEKTYGEAIDQPTLDAAYSVDGFRGGIEGAFATDTAATAFTGAPKLSSEGLAADANVGDYQVLIEKGDLYSESGYDMEFSPFGFIVIDPAPLTIIATPATKTYDGTRESKEKPTVAGTLFGDDEFIVLEQQFWSAHAGTHSLFVNYQLDDGNDGFNYDITVVDGEGTIIPASITITATKHDRVYDGTTASDEQPQVTAGTLFAGDILYAKQEFDSKHVGDRILKVTEYSIDDGNGGLNYNIKVEDGKGSITKAAITITAASETRTYDGTVVSSGTPTRTAGTLFADDSLSGLEQEFDAPHAGERTLRVTGYTLSDGNNGENYEVTLVTGNGTINPKILTAALIGTVQKTYDGTKNAILTASNFDLSGALTNDEVEIHHPGSGTYDTKNVGESKTVSVNGLKLVGKDASNYVLGEDMVSAATGVITRAELIVRARDFTKLSGAPNPAFIASFDGFATGDTPSVLTGELIFATEATTESLPGRYAIHPMGLSATNYTITYEPGILTIVSTPKVAGAHEDAYQTALWYVKSAFQRDFRANDTDEDFDLEVIQ